MLLAIDIGNTHIVLGLYQHKKKDYTIGGSIPIIKQLRMSMR